MPKGLKTFGQIFLLLGGAVGTVVGLVSNGLLWILAVAVAAAAAALAPTFIEWIRKIRGYPKLLEKAGDLQAEVQQMETELRLLDEKASSKYLKGLEEGIRQVWGGFLTSADAASSLHATGIALEDGQLVMYAELNEDVLVRPGARFLLQSTATGQVKGVMEVRRVQEDARVVLVCVGQEVPEFWDFLEAQLPGNDSVPKGLRFLVTAPPIPSDFEDIPIELELGQHEGEVS